MAATDWIVDVFAALILILAIYGQVYTARHAKDDKRARHGPPEDAPDA